MDHSAHWNADNTDVIEHGRLQFIKQLQHFLLKLISKSHPLSCEVVISLFLAAVVIVPKSKVSILRHQLTQSYFSYQQQSQFRFKPN